jgi:hypothetical protein
MGVTNTPDFPEISAGQAVDPLEQDLLLQCSLELTGEPSRGSLIAGAFGLQQLI